MPRTAEMLPRATTIHFWKRKAKLSKPCGRLLEKMSRAWSTPWSTRSTKRELKRPLSTCRIGAELSQSLLRQTKHPSLHPCHKSRIQSSSVAFRLPCDTPESHCV